MEEVRLMQHICFKSLEKRLSNQANQMENKKAALRFSKHPEVKVDHADPVSSPCIANATYAVQNDQFSPQTVPGKSFLFLPKLDHRDRLTSTPGPDQGSLHAMSQRTGESSIHDSTLSPVHCDVANPTSDPNYHMKKNYELDGIKSILFPQPSTIMEDAGRVIHAINSTDMLLDSANKRKRSSSSEESCPTLCGEGVRHSIDFSCVRQTATDFKTLRDSQSLASSPHKMKIMEHTSSFYHDSGLESMNVSSISNTTGNEPRDPVTSAYGSQSPLKRQASRDVETVSVESPMKRLAFMSLENQMADISQQHMSKTQRAITFSEPGLTFFCDRNVSEADNNLSIDSGLHSFASASDSLNSAYGAPGPIFANSIPFHPMQQHSPSRSQPEENYILQQMETSPKSNSSDDFKFTKPSLVLCRPRKKFLKGKASPPSPTSPQAESALANKFPAVKPPKMGSFAMSRPDKMGMEYVDVLTELADLNLHHVITNIFSNIRQKDILRCSRVSASWNEVCRSNRFLKKQIKSLKQHYRDEELARGSENITAKQAIENALLKSPAKLDVSSERSILRNIQNSTLKQKSPTEEPLLPTTPSGRNRFVEADTKFDHNQRVKRTLSFGETLLPCPKCQWTAKVYGQKLKNQAQCYRVACRFRFCVTCKGKCHWPNPCSTASKYDSPEKVTVKAGNKKRMARLKKRLLL